ncbi:hypothetical protein BaRGS_00028405 [Batillaria attramentaria]|uniref:Uncharacterized protein n=1 Tax=Batillaria attramentaria TaxID=370345 RepID=A0ABD0K0L3_9CAEN
MIHMICAVEYFSQRQVHLILLPETIRQVAMTTPGIKLPSFKLIPYHTGDKMAQTVTGDYSIGNCRPPAFSPPEPERKCKGTELTVCAVSKMDALVAVIRTLGWTEMTLVYDKNEEMAAKELSLGLSALAGHTHLRSYDVSMILGEPTTVSRSGEDDELFHFLNEIYVRRSAEMRMVLLCSVACNMRVLTAELPEILLAAFLISDTNITMNSSSVADSMEQLLNPHSACSGSIVNTLLWKTDGRRLSHVGQITSNGSAFTGNDVFPNIKFGFNKRKFLIGTLPGGYVGICVDLLNQLKASLNFSYEWTEPADQEWGRMTENNTWTGLVGLLERQEVDLVVAPLSIQAERERVMDFIHPFYLDYTTVLLKRPDPDESNWRRLIQPFKPQVHMCIWISLLCVAVVSYLLETVNPFYATNPRSLLHATDMFWYMYGALLMHGGARLPDSQSGRTMVSAFWLFSIVMAAVYGGNLIAFLTVKKDQAPFQTLQGLVQQDDYHWGTTGGAFYITIFQRSSNRVFSKLWAGIADNLRSDPDVLSLDPYKHLAKVKAGKYAYIGEMSTMLLFLKSECDLFIIKEQFLPLQYAVGLVNDSAYTSVFSDEMLKINENGLTEIWLRKWQGGTTFCSGSLIKEAKPVDLPNIQSAFYVAFIGIAGALLVLGVEGICRRLMLASKIVSLSRRHKRNTQDSNA